MRVFTDEQLQDCSKQNLERKLDMVKCSDELTREEQKQNIAKIEYYLNGKAYFTPSEVMDDIIAGRADDNDIVGSGKIA